MSLLVAHETRFCLLWNWEVKNYEEVGGN